jgi:hypothetical protein
VADHQRIGKTTKQKMTRRTKMIEMIKVYFIINTVIMSILLCWLITMCVLNFKRKRNHKDNVDLLAKEKDKLKNSRDFHINELKKRAGYSTEEVGYELGERGEKR